MHVRVDGKDAIPEQINYQPFCGFSIVDLNTDAVACRLLSSKCYFCIRGNPEQRV